MPVTTALSFLPGALAKELIVSPVSFTLIGAVYTGELAIGSELSYRKPQTRLQSVGKLCVISEMILPNRSIRRLPRRKTPGYSIRKSQGGSCGTFSRESSSSAVFQQPLPWPTTEKGRRCPTKEQSGNLAPARPRRPRREYVCGHTQQTQRHNANHA
jgi:hypothetical protein